MVIKKDEEGVSKFSNHLLDRFGPLPTEVEDFLGDSTPSVGKQKKLGVEKTYFEGQQMTCYFCWPASRDDFYSSACFPKKLLRFAQFQLKGIVK